jgi:hypothetical protein
MWGFFFDSMHGLGMMLVHAASIVAVALATSARCPSTFHFSNGSGLSGGTGSSDTHAGVESVAACECDWFAFIAF